MFKETEVTGSGVGRVEADSAMFITGGRRFINF